jgi:hypothetical protein
MKQTAVKNGTFAIYQGKEYSAELLSMGEIMLRSSDREDLQKGFEPFDEYDVDFLYAKYVDKDEIERMYRIQAYARYREEKFLAEEEKDGKVCIYSMSGDWNKWKEMGMKQEDKGVFFMWVPREEVKLYYKVEPYTEKDFEED